MLDGPLQQVDGGVMIHVHAFPKSRHNEIANVRNGRLIVRVTAPPEDGKANSAIVKLLADALSIAHREIAVVSGSTSRHKSLLIRHLSSEQIVSSLNL